MAEGKTLFLVDIVVLTITESATSYLEREIFPVLLPGLEEMLHVASTTEVRKIIIII